MPRDHNSPLYDEYSFEALKKMHLEPTGKAVGKVGNQYKIVNADSRNAIQSIFQDKTTGKRYGGPITGYEHPLDGFNRHKFMKGQEVNGDPVTISIHRGNPDGLETLVGRQQRNFTERHAHFTETGKFNDKDPEKKKRIRQTGTNLNRNRDALKDTEPEMLEWGRRYNAVRDRDKKAYQDTNKALWKMILTVAALGFAYIIGKNIFSKGVTPAYASSESSGYSEQMDMSAANSVNAAPSKLEIKLTGDYAAGNDINAVRDYLMNHSDRFSFIETGSDWYIQDMSQGKIFEVPKKCSLDDYFSKGSITDVNENGYKFSAYMGGCSGGNNSTEASGKGAYALLAIPAMIGTLIVVASASKPQRR